MGQDGEIPLLIVLLKPLAETVVGHSILESHMAMLGLIPDMAEGGGVGWEDGHCQGFCLLLHVYKVSGLSPRYSPSQGSSQGQWHARPSLCPLSGSRNGAISNWIDSSRLFALLYFVWGPHPVVLRSHSKQCSDDHVGLRVKFRTPKAH